MLVYKIPTTASVRSVHYKDQLIYYALLDKERQRLLHGREWNGMEFQISS